MTTRPMMTYIDMLLALSRFLGSDPLPIYIMPAKSNAMPAIAEAMYFARLYIFMTGCKIWSKVALSSALGCWLKSTEAKTIFAVIRAKNRATPMITNNCLFMVACLLTLLVSFMEFLERV